MLCFHCGWLASVAFGSWFFCLSPRRSDLRQQWQLASASDILLGACGAGLAWSAFMAAGSTLVELLPFMQLLSQQLCRVKPGGVEQRRQKDRRNHAKTRKNYSIDMLASVYIIIGMIFYVLAPNVTVAVHTCTPLFQ